MIFSLLQTPHTSCLRNSLAASALLLLLTISMLVLTFLCAFYMSVVALMIQFLVYPAFSRMGEAFVRVHRLHVQRMGWLVGPVMLLEMVSALWLLLSPLVPLGWWNLLQAAQAVGNFLFTGFYFVPLHKRLAVSFDEKVHQRLLIANGFRTLNWIARVLLLSVLWINEGKFL